MSLLEQNDDEFFVRQSPFKLEEVVHIAVFLKHVLLRFYFGSSPVASGSAHAQEFATSNNSSPVSMDTRNEEEEDEDEDASVSPSRAQKMGKEARLQNRLQFRATSLFQQLRGRQARRSFSPKETWLMGAISGAGFTEDIYRNVPRANALLREVPFVLPFDDRVKIFYHKIEQDRQKQAEMGISFAHGRGHRITIRRDNVLIDGFEVCRLFSLSFGLSINCWFPWLQ